MRKKLGRALGELGLIFVGVTLALAFESWNSDRVERIQEQELLAALAADLDATAQDLRRDITESEVGVDELGLVVAWQDGEPLQDSVLFRLLGSMGSTSALYPKISAYESIRTIGLDLVSNGELRSLITSLHELTLGRAMRFEGWRNQVTVEVLQPFIRRNLIYVGEGGVREGTRQAGTYLEAPLDRLRPLEVAALRANPEFRIIVREMLTAESGALLGYRQLETEIRAVLLVLRRELGQSN